MKKLIFLGFMFFGVLSRAETTNSICSDLFLQSAVGWDGFKDQPELMLLRNQNITVQYRPGLSEETLPVTRHPLGPTNTIITRRNEYERTYQEGNLQIQPKSLKANSKFFMDLLLFPNRDFSGTSDDLSTGNLAFLYHRPHSNVRLGYRLDIPEELKTYMQKKHLSLSFPRGNRYASQLEDLFRVRYAARDAKVVRENRGTGAMSIGSAHPGEGDRFLMLNLSIADQTLENNTRFYQALTDMFEKKMPHLLDPASSVVSPWDRLTGRFRKPYVLSHDNEVQILTEIGYLHFSLTPESTLRPGHRHGL